jgi:UPF0755 protein
LKRTRRFFLSLLLLAGIAGGTTVWLRENLKPMAPGPKRYIRWETTQRLPGVLTQLQRRGIIRNRDAARVYAWFRRTPGLVGTGTYELAPGMTVQEVLRELQKPIRQMVRVPETNWARRTANYLEQKAVLRAEEYMELVNNPSEFKDLVSFPLPDKSLEGYLYPDTYDFPPLIGARAVITRQLKNFERKVWQELRQPEGLHELIVKASLVELEAGKDEERPVIAGVIENRLKKKMRLQIDAALLYGIQKWRRLTFADYREIDSPYNLYRHDGLPPGPICSPSILSIKAALNPASHNHLYYVALPSGHSLFAPTYDQHLGNIRKRRNAVRELEQQKS